ncbi:unnamed protein product [Danaus chrysippus]|uniref:(African queen) hypothetical protein n=1 Tax=Danaus chrysippus TaxID=151541 RepID=A0A8J2R637_9NEOP|nr:unnamed protein product [Danaus chrysippus]
MDMQANYPKKLKTTYWDPLNIDYPVRKCFNTGISSETMARVWRSNPEVMLATKHPINEERSYIRDYNVTNDLLKTQNSLDYGYKISETNRFNKHNACNENSYIYPPNKQLEVNVPAMTAHGTSEMRSSFIQPVIPSRVITDKDQFKHPNTIYTEPVRSPKPKIDEWRLPVTKYRSIYDREKFKDEFREIRTHHKPQWLLLSVYYESNCPDSKAFILNQLQPAFQLLHDHMTIKFVPFGKARSINFGDGGFQCQHGPSECLGNIMQDCSLHYMKEKPDKHKLAYVACEMKTRSASQGRFDCVQQANLPTNLIEQCIFHGKGTSFQLESEYLTSLVNHKFIPTVTINGVYNQRFQDDAQEDLMGALCSLLKGVQPCSQYYNYMALRNLMSTKYPLLT